MIYGNKKKLPGKSGKVPKMTGINKDLFRGFYRGRRVFVTGHTGFKGSWLSLWLTELGADVFGYALGIPTKPSLFECCGLSRKMESDYADIRDIVKLKKVLKKAKPEVVFHLAAQSLVRHSYLEPVETYSTNVIGTVNLLEACRSTPSVRSIIVITSDKCYENNGLNSGYKETDRLGGYDPYSNSKGCSELVVSAYRNSFFNPAEYKKHRLVVASARAGNVIGGGDWGEDRLLPDCFRSLMKGEIIKIRNPKAIRPWQYVLEPLRGYLLLGVKIFREGISFGGGWNFGPVPHGVVPVGKMADQIVKAWDAGEWENVPDAQAKSLHEAEVLTLNIRKAKNKLGWRPVLTMSQTVKMTAEWYKHFYRYSSGMLEFSIRQIRNYERILMKKDQFS